MVVILEVHFLNWDFMDLYISWTLHYLKLLSGKYHRSPLMISQAPSHYLKQCWFESHSIHYSDVIMSVMASPITSISIVCSLPVVRGIQWWPVDSPHKGPVTWINVIKWKNFLSYRPFVRGIHRSPVNSLHKGQWRGALMFSLICAWTNSWGNNGNVGDFRCHRTHYDIIVMLKCISYNTLTLKCGRMLRSFRQLHPYFV